MEAWSLVSKALPKILLKPPKKTPRSLEKTFPEDVLIIDRSFVSKRNGWLSNAYIRVSLTCSFSLSLFFAIQKCLRRSFSLIESHYATPRCLHFVEKKGCIFAFGSFMLNRFDSRLPAHNVICQCQWVVQIDFSTKLSQNSRPAGCLARRCVASASASTNE